MKFIALEPDERLDIEWLPAYTPEFNLVEQVWRRSEYTNLANHICKDVGESRNRRYESLRHMHWQQSPFIIELH